MSYFCHHLICKGVNIGKRCGERVSKLDPEGRYCAKHRICVFLVKPKEDKIVGEKEPIKYINYYTFCQSIASKPQELKVIEELFQKVKPG